MVGIRSPPTHETTPYLISILSIPKIIFIFLLKNLKITILKMKILNYIIIVLTFAILSDQDVYFHANVQKIQ